MDPLTYETHLRRRAERALEHARLAGVPAERWGLTLTVTRKRAPRAGTRVRVLPGLTGECVGSEHGGRYFVVVKAAELLRALDRVAARRPK